MYCPDTWNYDAKVKALVIALWWATTLLHVNSTECGCSLNFNGVLILLNGVTKVLHANVTSSSLARQYETADGVVMFPEAAKKPDKMRVELLSNHIGESFFEFTQISSSYPRVMTPPEGMANFQPKIPTTTGKRDPQLMLREKFWTTQPFDSCVVTVKETATEWKFPANFYKQAVRGKLTFSCKEDNYKLKLYDEGATL
ncbi:hypothetical protein P5673_012484 [Acropora cervicornis]|uniref:Uncharacterized protein n=1 Tax=Acropora cervicornis TaxID=6130 RepID=A0AAD9QN01_ACRCE|nr:hypothetical protein P5673_012484 [Acropora cervicornis]